MLLFGFLLFPMILATERELNINNYVVKIEEDTLKSITVTNRSADALILSNLKLRHINKNAFDDVGNIKTLSISNNKLLHIPEYAFVNLTKLEHLDLSNNQISEFRNVFVGLNNLKFVNVSNNFMRYFTRGFFFGLTNFSEIIVEKYMLNFINSGMFENPFLKSISSTTLNEEQPNDDEGYLQRLIENLRVKICIQEGKVKSLEAIKTDEVLTSDCSEVLVVDRSRTLLLDIRHITEFERGWYRLQDFPIDSIDLGNNEIVQITSEMLNDLPAGLKKVSLWGNYITRLEKGIIENVHLSTLDLGYNNIREIEDGALEKMNLTGSLYLNSNLLKDTKFVATLPPNLTELSLSKNAITEISAGSFLKLGKLRNLRLDRNNITAIHRQSFRGLGNLQRLDLSFNFVEKLGNGALYGLQKSGMRDIPVHYNPIEIIEGGLFDDV